MLTLAEEKELSQLEAEEQQALAAQRPAPSNLTSEEEKELAQLEAEEQFALTQQQAAPEQLEISQDEADLGFSTHAKYVLDPFHSNRRALLQEKFGKDNVVENDKGDLYIKQNGKLHPVNAEGLSLADIPEFLGAAPEMIGGSIGGALGFGAASVPGAMAGGAIGSVARQGLSALVGTPQVATPLERAIETGLSAALSGAGQFVANSAKGAAKMIISKISPKMGASIDKAAQVVVDQKLGMPTLGQKLGPASTIGKMEKDLAEIPLFGRGMRKEFEGQANKVVSELKNSIGDFSSEGFSPESVGSSVKNIARSKVQFLHDTSSELFKNVDEVAGDIVLPGRQIVNELTTAGKNIRVISPQGGLAPYTARSGLDEETFGILQKNLSNVISGVRNTALKEGTLIGEGLPVNHITLKELNLIRQSVTKTLGSSKIAGTNAERYLKKFEQSLLDVTEKELSKVNPDVAKQFTAARTGWREFRKFEDVLKKSNLAKKEFGELSDEHVTRDMFKNLQSVKDYEKLVGTDAVREAASNHLAKLVRQKSKDAESITGGTILNALKNNESVYKTVFGPEKYRKITDLLSFDQGLKLLANPSGTATKAIRTDIKKIVFTGSTLRGILSMLNGAVAIPEKSIKAVARFSPQVQEFKKNASYFTRGPKTSPQIVPGENDIAKERQTKRQRALSSEGQ